MKKIKTEFIETYGVPSKMFCHELSKIVDTQRGIGYHTYIKRKSNLKCEGRITDAGFLLIPYDNGFKRIYFYYRGEYLFDEKQKLKNIRFYSKVSLTYPLIAICLIIGLFLSCFLYFKLGDILGVKSLIPLIPCFALSIIFLSYRIVWRRSYDRIKCEVEYHSKEIYNKYMRIQEKKNITKSNS